MKTFAVIIMSIAIGAALSAIALAEVYDSGPVHGTPEHIHVDVPEYNTPKATFTPYIAKTFKDIYERGNIRLELGYTGRIDKGFTDYFNDGTIAVKTGLEF